MDLHNRLKDLNNLPEEKALKARIYEGIHQPQKKPGFTMWKEACLLIAVAVIALFLVIVPESVPNNQTASGPSVQEIYRYFGGEEGEFSARSSSLYTSIDKVEDQIVYHFFNNLPQYVQEADGKLGPYITDVIVMRDGKEERYQVSDEGMLHVDTGKFYSSDSDMYEEVFSRLYSSSGSSWGSILLPIVVIGVGLYSSIFYKRRKLEQVNPFKGNWWLYIFMIVFLIIIVWGIFDDPLYKPLLVIFALLYGAAIWIATKRSVQSYVAYKFEAVKVIIITITLVIFLLFL
ncbi:hypothetical protein [Solibacillus sp. FSL H8-0538]|uniref:hypothetical protein n=1 Tax=Solibacillus sp. FSL H8-0538 TaxID=2921400 RepID=UPI0030F69EDE